MVAVEERFWSKVNKTNYCWIWVGGTKSVGYGSFTIGPKKGLLAHRISYEWEYGNIPEGKYICHKCDNRLCVKPSHLFVGTQKDNMQDCVNKGRIARGQKIPQALLTEHKVLAIRRKFVEGVSKETLAKQYGVTKATIYDVVARRNWRHI